MGKRSKKPINPRRRDEIRVIQPWDRPKVRPGVVNPKEEYGRNSLLMEKQLEDIFPRKMPINDRLAAMISKFQHENLQLKALVSTYEQKIREAGQTWKEQFKRDGARIKELEEEIERLKNEDQRRTG